MTDMADSNGKAEIDFTNVELPEFSVHNVMSLADGICKTCCKWAIDDFIKCSNNDLIMSLIINIGAESTTQMKESTTICRPQIDKLDCLDIGNIDHFGEDVISLWHEIIRRNGQLIKIDTHINHNQHKFNPLDYLNSLTEILESIIDKIEMFEEYLTKLKYNCLSKNLQAIILYNIIQNRRPLNYV